MNWKLKEGDEFVVFDLLSMRFWREKENNEKMRFYFKCKTMCLDAYMYIQFTNTVLV